MRSVSFWQDRQTETKTPTKHKQEGRILERKPSLTPAADWGYTAARWPGLGLLNWSLFACYIGGRQKKNRYEKAVPKCLSIPFLAIRLLAVKVGLRTNTTDDIRVLLGFLSSSPACRPCYRPSFSLHRSLETRHVYCEVAVKNAFLLFLVSIAI